MAYSPPAAGDGVTSRAAAASSSAAARARAAAGRAGLPPRPPRPQLLDQRRAGVARAVVEQRHHPQQGHLAVLRLQPGAPVEADTHLAQLTQRHHAAEHAPLTTTASARSRHARRVPSSSTAAGQQRPARPPRARRSTATATARPPPSSPPSTASLQRAAAGGRQTCRSPRDMRDHSLRLSRARSGRSETSVGQTTRESRRQRAAPGQGQEQVAAATRSDGDLGGQRGGVDEGDRSNAGSTPRRPRCRARGRPARRCGCGGTRRAASHPRSW